MDTIFITKSIDEVVSALSGTRIFSLDIETTGLNPIDSRILLVQLGIGEMVYVIDHARVDIRPILPFLADPNIMTIIHQAKFEGSFFYHMYKTSIAGVWDSLLAERVINPDALNVSLETVAFNRLGRKLNKETRKTFYESKNSTFSAEQIRYAAEDAEVLLPIQGQQEEELNKLDLLKIAQLEFSVAPIVARMELTGVPIDVEGWKSKIVEYHQLKKKASEAMHVELFDKGNLDEQMGLFERDGINLGSPKQVKSALNELGLDVKSTDERTISTVNHPAARALSEYRRIEKVLTSYSDTFLSKIHPFTGRIHPDYQQLGTETGRFSCREPNVQQIPPEFRKYVTDPQYAIISADYAQIELRILAEVSRDPRLIQALNSGEDLHRVTASVMFETPIDKVTPDQRSAAKTLNFGIMYGMGGPKLMDKLNETREEGHKLSLEDTNAIHERYKKTYSRALYWLNAAGNRAWETEQSRTIYGRKRFFTRPSSAGLPEKEYIRQMLGLKRQGANSVIQGTSADMTKLALVELQDRLDYEGYRANIIIQVHDEFVILAHKTQAEAVKLVVQDSMKTAGEILVKSVPILVDAHISDVWSKG